MERPVAPTELNAVDVAILESLAQQALRGKRNLSSGVDEDLLLLVNDKGVVRVQLGAARFDEFDLWLQECHRLAATDTVSCDPGGLGHYAWITFFPR